jgi:hypothetical protein
MRVGQLGKKIIIDVLVTPLLFEKIKYLVDYNAIYKYYHFLVHNERS